MKFSIRRRIKEEFRFSNFGFDHDPIESMVRSQWQSHSQSKIYLVYRWIFAFIVTYTVFTSFYHHITEHSFGLYFIYLTRWGILLNMTVGIYSAILVTMWYYSSSFREDVSKAEKMPTKFKVYWALHNSALTIAIVITIVFWTLIFDETTPLDQVTIMSHVVNSVIMFIELCLVAHPQRIYHFIQPVCCGIIYGLFTYIYYVCGGLNTDGDSFIYKVLNWGAPSETLRTICGTLILCTIVHLILFLIHALRVFIHCIYSRCRSTNLILPTTSPKNNAHAIATTDPIQMTTLSIEKDGESRI